MGKGFPWGKGKTLGPGGCVGEESSGIDGGAKKGREDKGWKAV